MTLRMTEAPSDGRYPFCSRINDIIFQINVTNPFILGGLIRQMSLSPPPISHVRFHMQFFPRQQERRHHRTSHQHLNTSRALNDETTSHVQSETAYETNASGASASVDVHISHANISHRKLGSSQQNGPICKGPAHDCTRGRSLL